MLRNSFYLCSNISGASDVLPTISTATIIMTLSSLLPLLDSDYQPAAVLLDVSDFAAREMPQRMFAAVREVAIL